MDELRETYGITLSRRLEVSFSRFLPDEWYALLSQANRDVNGIGLYVMNSSGILTDLAHLHANDIYKACINKSTWEPTSRGKWLSIYPLDDDVVRIGAWREWYQLPYKISREVRLQSFQYRVINRTVPCRYYLKQLCVADSDLCQFCDDIDDLFHFLYGCAYTRAFWDSLAIWLREHSIVLSMPNVMSETEFLFGLLGNADAIKRVNFILLLGKFYVYKTKIYANGNLCVYSFLVELRNILTIERRACMLENKLREKFRIWSDFYDEL